MLQKLLPDAPVPSLTPLQLQRRDQTMESVKSMWKLWIDTHQADLRQMKPSAEGISFDSEACSDVADSSAVERRLKRIAGDRAIVCGLEAYGREAATIASRCVKKSFARRKAFYASYFLGGNALWSSIAGIAGDGKGIVFVLSYDDAGAPRAGLGENAEVFDNGNTLVEQCPKPIKYRESFGRNLTCISQSGSLRLSPQ